MEIFDYNHLINLLDWKKLNYITIPNSIETFDIDTEEDFEIAKLLYKKFIKKK